MSFLIRYVSARASVLPLAILCSGMLASCSSNSTEPTDKHGSSTTPVTNASENSATVTMSLPSLPGLKEHRFDNVIRNVAEREDPVVDGWDSERFTELAGAQLKKLGKLLSHPEELNNDKAALLANDEFAAAFVRPPSLRQVFGDKSLVVLRAEETEAESALSGVGGFVSVLRQQAEPLKGLDDVRFKFKIVRVAQEGDATDTRAYFQISGRNETQAVQVNATWTCNWVVEKVAGKDVLPKLTHIGVENYEEIIYRSPTGSMFADCTESVFADTDRFQRQLIQGLDHWTDRFDGSIARPAAGHGIAVGDVNDDGLDDLYLCQSPGLPNLLLIQNSDGTVRDTAVEANVNWLEGTRAALFSDLDNDGDQDLVAVLGNRVVIQANDGTGRFELKTIVRSVSSLFSINAVDYDNDADLDLYICGYTLTAGVDLNDVFANPMPFHDANNGAPNVMLRNDGDWSFEDVTDAIGLDENNSRFSYASAWDDFDGDGDLDVYVANDFGRNNLYQNNRGVFIDVAPQADVEDIGPGMSAAWGDYNNDGKPDIYVSNMFSSAGNRITHQTQFKTGLDENEKQLFRRHARGNSLFENVGNGQFNDRSVDLGVTLGRWAWGSLFVDLNNDGWEDIYVTNGFMTADDNNDL